MDAIRTEAGGSSSISGKLASPALKVKQGSATGSLLPRRGVEETKVLGVRTLTAEGEPVKKHVEIQLPPGSKYRAGDYLAILPSNPKASVLRALRRFNIPVNSISFRPPSRFHG